ncbi:MAG: aconitate hydratase [Mucinivorans sp.]
MMTDRMIIEHYATLPAKLDAITGPLTLVEKILYAHLSEPLPADGFARGVDYALFRPDRVAMQDATAQMALLQFMNAGRRTVAVPTSVHCDHLIRAENGAAYDLKLAKTTNGEVYNFLADVADKYGIDFWGPGAGIIHQVVLENYAFPGGMIIGTDSHTPNAGGLAMVAIGVGGADASDVMAGLDWELKMPRVIGVHLTGHLSGWAAAKDVILKLAGILTVKGATNAVIEYFGDGCRSISATGKATICNMGAEVGATCSIFPYDGKIREYLVATGREAVAEAADGVQQYLEADRDARYDQVIEIDLSTLEPYINGPFTPDAACSISDFAAVVKEKGYPELLEVGLIGSCTNSSYEDLSRSASVARDAEKKGIRSAAQFIITPGSESVYETAARDEILAPLRAIGGTVMANACGACIGQWKRSGDPKRGANSIVTSFNRNFVARNDGNPLTHAFVASPELTTALTLAGRITFNPLKDKLLNDRGQWVMLDEPCGAELPADGYASRGAGRVLPSGQDRPITIDSASERLQLLTPFGAWDGQDMKGLALLIKVSGKCTTDHISAAGSWLRFRGHLANISQNMLMAAVNSFNGEKDKVFNRIKGEYDRVSASAMVYRDAGLGTIVVAEENYGEGSSREHAAMEPRFLGVRAVLAKSFARIHETNLKKQGVLALTFCTKQDYDLIGEHDTLDVVGLTSFEPLVVVHHPDGSSAEIKVAHTYNRQQIEWFEAGSALNLIRAKAQSQMY